MSAYSFGQNFRMLRRFFDFLCQTAAPGSPIPQVPRHACRQASRLLLWCSAALRGTFPCQRLPAAARCCLRLRAASRRLPGLAFCLPPCLPPCPSPRCVRAASVPASVSPCLRPCLRACVRSCLRASVRGPAWRRAPGRASSGAVGCLRIRRIRRVRRLTL